MSKGKEHVRGMVTLRGAKWVHHVGAAGRARERGFEGTYICVLYVYAGRINAIQFV